MDKQDHTWWDIATLEKYKSEKIKPRSLRWDLGLNDGMSAQDLLEKFKHFFIQCDKKKRVGIIHRIKCKLNQIEQKIADPNEKLTPHTDSAEYKEKEKKIQDMILKVVNDTKTKKNEVIFKGQKESTTKYINGKRISIAKKKNCRTFPSGRD